MQVQELGLDCVAWAPPVYHDLLRSGDGTAEGIVAAYFGMVSAASSDSYCAFRILSIMTCRAYAYLCMYGKLHNQMSGDELKLGRM